MPKKAKNAARSQTAKPTPLLFADSAKSADQRYVGGFNVPDPFIALQIGKQWHAVLNQLEFSRALKESRFDKIIPLEDALAAARAHFKRQKVGYAEVIAVLAGQFSLASFVVPSDFPAGLAFKLLELGFGVDAVDGSLFPSRETKTEEEIEYIREGNRCSAKGILAAEKALRRSAARKGKLYLDGKLLTSERLRGIIEVACLEAGSVSMDTIAAGGDQACDPHCCGHGPLRANELIIVDVFPRVTRTGYYGDMTRTFLKGKASDAQKALVAAVFKAQQEALARVKAGVNGKTIHAGVVDTFLNHGYKTTRDELGSRGFIHGTGHGLGLEIHEAPRVSAVDHKLKRNTVVTIEPGLYYPGLGGCRIEDVAVARKDGPEVISSCHYRWELR